MNKPRYDKYVLQLEAHSVPASNLRQQRWTSSAKVARWKEPDQLPVCMSWPDTFATESDAIAYAFEGAKRWADAHKS